MRCIEAQQLVKPYIEGQLSDKQLEQFLEHVEQCPECYEELEIYFSIYETLESSGENSAEENYDFEGKLMQNMKNSRRYLHFRKAYRFFRFAVVLLAEFLLVCTIITGIELKGDAGSKGTTLYRVIYGKDGEIEIDYLSESEAEEFRNNNGPKTDEENLQKEAVKEQELQTEQTEQMTEKKPNTEQTEEMTEKKTKTGADKNE